MNPIHWFRWKVLIGLAVVLGGFAFFGVNPLARYCVNDLGSRGLGARWHVDDVKLAPTGRLDLRGVVVARVDGEPEPTLAKGGLGAAESVQFSLDPAALLRRQFRGELIVQSPRLRIERSADGSLNLTPPRDESQSNWPDISTADWARLLDEWLKRLEQIDEKRRQVAERLPESKEERSEGKRAGPAAIDYARRVSYPYASITRFAATRIVCENLVIEFIEQSPAGARKLPPLTDGRLEIAHVSDNPSRYSEPIRWTLAGKIDGAPVKLAGELDMRSPDGTAVARHDLNIDFQSDGLPIELVEFLASDSLPVVFDQGQMQIAAKMSVRGERLDVRPVLGFRDAAVSPRPGAKSIAGIEPAMFCQAFNEIGTLEISDIRVAGTLSSPDIELGDTIPNLVKSSGKAIARKQIDKGIEQGKEKAREAVGKQLDQFGGSEVLDNATKILPGRLGEPARTKAQSTEEPKPRLLDRVRGLPFGESKSNDRPVKK